MNRMLFVKLKEALLSVLPVTLIVILLNFTSLVNVSLTEIIVFTVSALFLTLGIGLCTLGADIAKTPMGEQVGSGLTKTRNLIHNYKCQCCHKNVTANDYLPRGVTYGDNVNSIVLSMMNESNTPLNKITSFFTGITDNEINALFMGLIKIVKKAAKESADEELKRECFEANQNFRQTIIDLNKTESELKKVCEVNKQLNLKIEIL